MQDSSQDTGQEEEESHRQEGSQDSLPAGICREREQGWEKA